LPPPQAARLEMSSDSSSTEGLRESRLERVMVLKVTQTFEDMAPMGLAEMALAVGQCGYGVAAGCSPTSYPLISASRSCA
jgi:hypothetical protein